MRTTLTLDADVRSLLERRVRERGVSFKEAVNDALRAGLGGSSAAAEPYRTPYAINEQAHHHLAARRWLEQALNGATR